MQIRLSAQHSELPLGLDEAAADTIGRLERFDPRLQRADVHLSVEHNPRIHDRILCEVTLHGGGEPVHCQVAGPDVPTTLTRAMHRLEHLLEKRKTQRLHRRHEAGTR